MDQYKLPNMSHARHYLSLACALFFVSLFFGLLIRDYLRRRRHPPAQLAAERTELEAQMLRPDWAFYEHHLQRPAPAALRELYADRDLVTAVGLKYGKRDALSTFNSLAESQLIDTRELLGLDIIAFATSDCGDPIYLRPGAAESDTVYITYHDTNETKVFAESVAVMLQTLRQSNREG